MKLCFFGAYDHDYPRNAIIRKGLRSNGVEVSECWLAPKYKFWFRYPILFFRSRRCLGMENFFFVPEFCQKDVPLARILSFLAANKVIFDPLASRFESWLPQSVLPLNIASADICLGIFGKSEKTKRVVPHKIFQAMAMKKPIITLRTPAVEELFSHRKHIFFCPSPNPSNLARAILELKKDSLLREEIGERGYRLVSQNFSPEAIGHMFIDILERNFGPSSRRAVN